MAIRNIVIDGSLLGMGRIPGNLCIEQMMDHLNYEYGTNYKTEPAFDAIDDYIAPIKKQVPWGYAIPYALSARFGLHRTYAEYLIKKWKLRTSDIERILLSVEHDEAELFNDTYIERLYREYMSVEIDDKLGLDRLEEGICKKEILLIAPGASINKNRDKIKRFCDEKHPIVIGIHCIPDFVDIHYEFFSNIKRMDVLKVDEEKVTPILTSNLIRYDSRYYKAIIVNYSSCAYHDEEYCDDSVLMFLNVLKKLGILNISIAGFDGVRNGIGEFYIDSLSRSDRPVEYSEDIKRILKKHYSDVCLNFLTESYYE